MASLGDLHHTGVFLAEFIFERTGIDALFELDAKDLLADDVVGLGDPKVIVIRPALRLGTETIQLVIDGIDGVDT